MTGIDTYRKRAREIQRWHRERHASVSALIRILPRFAGLDDAAVLAMPVPLALAQEVAAAEAGFASWQALREGAALLAPPATGRVVQLGTAVPVLFVRDVEAAAGWWRDRLGFRVAFLHGEPPFYGEVARDAMRLHLRHVARPWFAAGTTGETAPLLALVEVDGVKALFAEAEAAEVDIAQRLTRQPWGGLDFAVRDPDGNVVGFVEYRSRPVQSGSE